MTTQNSSTFKANEKKLLASTFISNVGDGMHTIALAQFLYTYTGSVYAFSWVITLNYLLGAFVQLLAGPLSDRYSRKKYIIFLNLIQAFFVAILSLGIGLEAPANILITMSIALKICFHFIRPGQFAIITDTIQKEKIPAYHSYSMVAMQIGQLLGISLLGPLLKVFQFETIFLFDALTFLLAAACTGLLKIKQTSQKIVHKYISTRHLATEWINAWYLVKGTRGLFVHIMMSASLFLIYEMLNLALPIIIKDRFGGDTMWLSYLDSTFAVGCIISAIAAKKLINFSLASFWLFIQASALASIVFFSSSFVALIGFFLIGFAASQATAIFLGSLQKRVPDNMQGRVASLRQAMISCLVAIIIPTISIGFSDGLERGFVSCLIVLFSFALLSACFSSKRWFGSYYLGSTN